MLYVGAILESLGSTDYFGIAVLFVSATAAFPSEGESKNDDGKYGQGRCDDGPHFEAQINK